MPRVIPVAAARAQLANGATRVTKAGRVHDDKQEAGGFDMQLLRFTLMAVAISLAAPAFAQQVRERIIQENPSRTVGGSCIYGGDGKLIHAPRGATCPEREQPPASMAPSAREAAPAASAPPALPANVRSEAAELLVEREHLDVELARVREAVAYEDREAARGAVDAALRKIARHLEREARLLQAIAAVP
jgi:hypothetical protein